MKLKNIFASFIAAATVLFGCAKEEAISTLAGLSVSEDYITLAADENASATITVNGVEAWSASIADSKVTWLTITPASGSAGQDVNLRFTAEASSSSRSAEVYITMGGKTKIIKVNQAAPVGVEVPLATCKDVIDGPDVTYKVRGTCVRVANTSYGNWYLADETGEIYIYGTVNAKGAYPKDAEGGWDGFGIAVGDIVTVEGPKTVYNGTVELVDVSIVSVEKSKIDVADFEFEMLPAEETVFEMTVSAKVEPLLVTSDASWLQITDVKEGGVYVLHADENVRTANRTANVTIKGPGALKTVSVTQAGVPATGASVSEIIAVEDGSQVETLPNTVVIALTTRGAVLSDGKKAIYAYGNSAAALKVGDGVKMAAEKTTCNGVPELTNITDVFVDSEGNEVVNPTAEDITASAATYNASEAEFIKLSGTLSVSGNYYNIALDGIDTNTKQGSIVYPVDALNAKSFDGKKITVTGWFNGLSGGGKFINIITTKIDEYVDNPKGTATNPYLASEVAAKLLAGDKFDEDIYIKGKVSAILYTFSASYGTGTFWISDDGVANGVSEDKKSTTEPSKDFECYSVYWFNNAQWAEGNAQLEVGDEVVVCGKTTVYNGIAETSSKKAWVYSVNGATSDKDGVGNANAPFNVDGAVAFIDRMEAAKAAAKAASQPAPTFPDVCVKGKISAVLYTFSASYGTGTFWISDDGVANGVSEDKKSTTEPSKDFECYSVYWGGNEVKWTEDNPQPAVGDEVIVKGQLTKYNSTYETASKKAWVEKYIPAN
ncbi:MAG: BACON domain-containing protein [Bacteroidales bacterium]|nr:BACON domain-containing protein [Bacteroidales bacterium]